MADPRILVLPDRYVDGLADYKPDELFENGAVLPLSQAMAGEFTTDAHLVQYVAIMPDGDELPARVNKNSNFEAALVRAGGRIEARVLLVDCDNPEHAPWTDELYTEFVQRVASLPDRFAPTYAYTTAHGARLVYALSAPIPVAEVHGKLLSLWAGLESYGISADPLGDWGRLQRAPRVLRGDTATWEQTYFHMFEWPDVELDAGTLVTLKLEHAIPESPASMDVGGMPTPEECEELLTVEGARGRPRQSEWQRAARGLLRRRDLGMLERVDGARPLFPYDSESWDMDLTAILGRFVGTLFEIEGSTAEQVFALISPGLEQINAHDETPGHRDWREDGWRKLTYCWLQEVRKRHAAQERELEKAERARDLLDSLVERTMDADQTGEVPPSDPEEAKAWALQRTVLYHGRNCYVRRSDGQYRPTPVPRGDALFGVLRDETGDMLDLWTWGRNGRQPRTVADLLSEYGMPVQDVHLSVEVDGPLLHGREFEQRVLTLPLHRPVPMMPRHDDRVDVWLRQLIGDELWDHFCRYVAHFRTITKPICALNLIGETGGGKSLLTAGLAELFGDAAVHGPQALSKHNTQVRRSPVWAFEEGLPASAYGFNSIDEAFRYYVSGGSIRLEPKGEPVIELKTNPRMIMSSNGDEVTRRLIGKNDLTEDAIRALEQRVLTIEILPCSVLLQTYGGRTFLEANWVGASSHQHLARHLAFIAEEYKDSPPDGRLLVHGVIGKTLIRQESMHSDTMDAVIQTILRLIESETVCPPNSGLWIHEGSVFVTTAKVLDYYNSILQDKVKRPLSSKAVGGALRKLGDKDGVYRCPGQTEDWSPQRWCELDLPILYRSAIEIGLPRTTLERYIAETYGAHQMEDMA